MNTIITKNSTAPGIVPLATELAVGELAVNVADNKLYVKDNTGTVSLLNDVPSPTDTLQSLLPVDVTGSGLDADLLDGLHASSFQPAGTYNTIIGTDTDVSTSGSVIIDDIQVTDGVITSIGTRTLTIGDLGYTVSTNSSNNTLVQRTSSGYIRASYFNTTSNSVASGLTSMFAETNGDGYLRKATAGAVRIFIGKVNDSNLLDGLNLHSSSTGQFNVVPKIQSNGAMEIGRYLDFHYAADSDNFDWRMELSGGSNGALYFTDDGETRRFEFHDNGEFRADGNVVAYYSDERLKENITPITGALDKISKWQAVHYNANDVAVEASNGAYDKDIKEIGLLAQEIQKDFPEVTHPAPFDSDDNGESISGENYLTLDYAKVTPVLVSALQDQIEINKDLKNLIDDLQVQINNITGK